MKTKQVLIGLSLFGLAFFAASCKKSDSPGANAVFIQSMAFNPSTITVAKGTTVTWTNKDNIDHTVSSNDGTSFDKNPLSPGNSFSYTPATAGTFAYHCKIHTSMTATLIVTN